LRTESPVQPIDWMLAPLGDQEADLAGARASGRIAVEVFRDPNYAIYRLTAAK